MVLVVKVLVLRVLKRPTPAPILLVVTFAVEILKVLIAGVMILADDTNVLPTTNRPVVLRTSPPAIVRPAVVEMVLMTPRGA